MALGGLEGGLSLKIGFARRGDRGGARDVEGGIDAIDRRFS